MALFVGHLPSNLKDRALEDLFSKFGTISRCDVRSGSSGTFGFVTFADRRDAEDCLKEMRDHEIDGQRITVEWTKAERGVSSRRDDRSGGRGRDDRSDRSSGFRCYNCDGEGHMARNCTKRRDDRGGRRSRSRSRSPRRPERRDDRRDDRRDSDRRRSGSRSPPRSSAERKNGNDRRSRSRSPRRSRSPARSTHDGDAKNENPSS